jgi:hypothetical protein
MKKKRVKYLQGINVSQLTFAEKTVTKNLCCATPDLVIPQSQSCRTQTYVRKFNDLYSSPNIVRVIKSIRMRWAGHVARMGERKGVHRALVGKPEGKRPLRRPRCRWEDNIKTDLQEVGCEGVWTGSSWLRIGQVGGICECGNEPSGSIQCEEFLD